jgi:hypothetical protein
MLRQSTELTAAMENSVSPVFVGVLIVDRSKFGETE